MEKHGTTVCFSVKSELGLLDTLSLKLQHGKKAKTPEDATELLDWPLLLRPLPFAAPPHCSHLKCSGLPDQQFNYSNLTVLLLHANKECYIHVLLYMYINHIDH